MTKKRHRGEAKVWINELTEEPKGDPVSEFAM